MSTMLCALRKWSFKIFRHLILETCFIISFCHMGMQGVVVCVSLCVCVFLYVYVCVSMYTHAYAHVCMFACS